MCTISISLQVHFLALFSNSKCNDRSILPKNYYPKIKLRVHEKEEKKKTRANLYYGKLNISKHLHAHASAPSSNNNVWLTLLDSGPRNWMGPVIKQNHVKLLLVGTLEYATKEVECCKSPSRERWWSRKMHILSNKRKKTQCCIWWGHHTRTKVSVVNGPIIPQGSKFLKWCTWNMHIHSHQMQFATRIILKTIKL